MLKGKIGSDQERRISHHLRVQLFFQVFFTALHHCGIESLIVEDRESLHGAFARAVRDLKSDSIINQRVLMEVYARGAVYGVFARFDGFLDETCAIQGNYYRIPVLPSKLDDVPSEIQLLGKAAGKRFFAHLPRHLRTMRS